MNIEAYLERINYPLQHRRSLRPEAETLRRLQVAHLLTVPFENLSIHAGEAIVLEDDALFTKIVTNRRGGFCYEANGLFAALLRAVGFDVEMLSAEVANAESEFGPNFDHMTLMVTPGVSPSGTTPLTLAQRWLVDVGFGDSFLEPLLLDEPGEQVQGSRAYRILSDHNHFTLMQRDLRLDSTPEWKTQYRFSLHPYSYHDFAEMCGYHQTSPESHFTRSRICSRATVDGRITLSDMRFITTSNSGGDQVRQERTLASEEEYARVLCEQFGIVMTS